MSCQARRHSDEMICGPCARTWPVAEESACPQAELRQVGGQHYAVLAMDPFEFCTTNGWDFPAATALKYLTRWRNKNGIEDLRKAKNCALARRDRLHREATLNHRQVRRIPMWTYCQQNDIHAADRDALYALEHVVRHPDTPSAYERLLASIDVLIAMADGVAS